MTSSENAKHTAGLNLAYLMGVKENQPTLLREAKRLCGWGAHKQVGYTCEAATAWEHYRGTRLRRELYRSHDIEGWPGWESARQPWRVKQTTEHTNGTVAVENRYLVTNLAWGRLNGAQILVVVRAYWGVENGCHWTLDVVMKQDTRCWCTTGKALRMLSWGAPHGVQHTASAQGPLLAQPDEPRDAVGGRPAPDGEGTHGRPRLGHGSTRHDRRRGLRSNALKGPVERASRALDTCQPHSKRVSASTWDGFPRSGRGNPSPFGRKVQRRRSVGDLGSSLLGRPLDLI